MGGRNDLVIVDTSAGLQQLRLADALDAGRRELAESQANSWIKSLRSLPIAGRAMRDRFLYRSDSLWWFTELYFHKTQVVSEIFRVLLALEAIVERHAPRAIRVPSGDPVLTVLAGEFARTRGLSWAGSSSHPRQRRAIADVIVRGHLYELRSRLAAWRAPRRPRADRARVAAFVHAAFWRSGGEQYTGPVLQALAGRLAPEPLALVGLGPRTSYRARTWKHRVHEAGGRMESGLPFVPIDLFARPGHLEGSRAIWRDRAASFRAVRRSPAVRAAAVIRGCDVWPLLEPVFADMAYLQSPWSAYVMDQLGAVLDEVGPRVAVTYAEAGAWGRALVLEARRRGIATVGLQHGFIYRHWLNYLHEADEMHPSAANPEDLGFPAPTRTLVYDRFTADHLVRAGRFDPEAIAVTGSARLDALAGTARELTPERLVRVRQRVGVSVEHSMVVVAAKYTQIASRFRDLVSTVASIPGVMIVVKCHPAEGPEPYLRDAGGASCVRIADASTDLAGLISAARLLVTVNSTASIEAMVLGTPSLVVALPNNLSPFVEAGVMAGVMDGAPLEPALRVALFDEAFRGDLARRADAFMREHQIGSDGRAATRAADAILALLSPASQRETLS